MRPRITPSGGWGHWLGKKRRQPGLMRSAMIGLASFGGMFLAGYLVAAVIVFPTPLSRHPQVVPRLIGMSATDAARAISRAKLKAGRPANAPHPTAPRGEVTWQDPPPNVVVPAGTEVDVTVSTGPQAVTVPDLVGYDVGFARSLIVAAGLNVGPVLPAQTTVPKDVVVTTRPASGTALSPGSSVSLVVSAGAPTITVPSVQGLTVQQARGVLEQAGLTLGTYFSKTSPAGVVAAPGTIIEQVPASGTLASPGTPITVHLARRGS
jgi:serine/threonine-protein kinase